MKTKTRNAMSLLASTALMAAIGSAAAADARVSPPATPAAAAKAQHVKDVASQALRRERRRLIRNAMVAQDEVLHALFYLEDHDTKRAFHLLADADGQLNVLLARDPHLKLVPIAVRANIVDTKPSLDKIHTSVKGAESALDAGNIQHARALLVPLRSEMHIDTDLLPLGIYPKAIKKASAEIQASRISDAESTLADALGSIVTSERVVPLPPIEAEGDVLDAEGLMKQGTAKNKAAILSLLSRADHHLADAEALGYGKYKPIRGEIAAIQEKVRGGNAKPGIFGHIKQMFHDLAAKV